MITALWLKLIAAHFVGDFAFQSTWMSIEKGKFHEVNLYHAATYTAAFVIFGLNLGLPCLGVLLVSHFIIDTFKARWKTIKSVWVDQLWHGLALAIVWYLS